MQDEKLAEVTLIVTVHVVRHQNKCPLNTLLAVVSSANHHGAHFANCQRPFNGPGGAITMLNMENPPAKLV